MRFAAALALIASALAIKINDPVGTRGHPDHEDYVPPTPRGEPQGSDPEDYMGEPGQDPDAAFAALDALAADFGGMDGGHDDGQDEEEDTDCARWGGCRGNKVPVEWLDRLGRGADDISDLAGGVAEWVGKKIDRAEQAGRDFVFVTSDKVDKIEKKMRKVQQDVNVGLAGVGQAKQLTNCTGWTNKTDCMAEVGQAFTGVEHSIQKCKQSTFFHNCSGQNETECFLTLWVSGEDGLRARTCDCYNDNAIECRGLIRSLGGDPTLGGTVSFDEPHPE